MSKNEISYKSELPKIKNIFTYAFFCLAKIIAIIFFGVGAMFLAIIVSLLSDFLPWATRTLELLPEPTFHTPSELFYGPCIL